MSDLQHFTPGRVLRRMGAVPEVAMRVALWRECFEICDSEALLPVVEAVLDAAEARQPAGHLGTLALIAFLETIRGQPAAIGLFAAATGGGAERVKALLIGAVPARVAGSRELAIPPSGEEREPTLGERRAWARRTDPVMVERLLFDSDVGVVRHLLSNPRMTEREVLRIASRRPSAPTVLNAVLRHPRWGQRPSIQAALVQNPYLAVEVAAGLVAVVDLALARALSTEPTVHARVRARAAARLSASARCWKIEEEPEA